MLINHITGSTRVIGKSQGYIGLPLRDEVRDEQLFDTVSQQDVPTMTTSWTPTPDELAAINAGAPIHVRIFGTGHPPILVFTGDTPEAG